MRKVVLTSITIGLLLILSSAVAQPWNQVDQLDRGYSNVAVKQTFLEGKAPSHPPGGYVKLRGLDVNPYVPDDCKLIIYDATFSNFGDSVARCDFSGRDGGGSAVFRNQVLYIGPGETLVLSFPEGRFLMENSSVEVGCLAGGPVWASVNGHIECWGKPPEEVTRLIDERIIKPLEGARSNLTGLGLSTQDEAIIHLDTAIENFRKYDRRGMEEGASEIIRVMEYLLPYGPRISATKSLKISWSALVKAVGDGAAVAGCYSGCGWGNWECIDECIKAEVCSIS